MTTDARWLAEVSMWQEIAVIAALRGQHVPRTHAWLARRLEVNPWQYPRIMWAAKKLAVRGLAIEWYRDRNGDRVGGSHRKVELLAQEVLL